MEIERNLHYVIGRIRYHSGEYGTSDKPLPVVLPVFRVIGVEGYALRDAAWIDRNEMYQAGLDVWVVTGQEILDSSDFCWWIGKDYDGRLWYPDDLRVKESSVAGDVLIGDVIMDYFTHKTGTVVSRDRYAIDIRWDGDEYPTTYTASEMSGLLHMGAPNGFACEHTVNSVPSGQPLDEDEQRELDFWIMGIASQELARLANGYNDYAFVDDSGSVARDYAIDVNYYLSEFSAAWARRND